MYRNALCKKENKLIKEINKRFGGSIYKAIIDDWFLNQFNTINQLNFKEATCT